MLSRSRSDKFLRSKWLRSLERWRFTTWSRAARNQTMPVSSESETPLHRTQQQAAVDQTGVERAQPLIDSAQVP